MTSREGTRPASAGRSLGVWLSLLALLACAIILIRGDTQQVEIPLQIKRAPAARRPAPAATIAPVPAAGDPADSPVIRVNVTPGGADNLQLRIRGPYSIRPVGSSRVLSSADGLASARVQSTATGLKIGNSAFRATALEIVPRQDPAIHVNDHLYRGVIRLHRRTDGQVSAVNVLPVEQYLGSVVDSEMPAAFPEAARQAQAIVSRTYALYQMAHADRAAVFDLYSSQRSQKYLGVEYTTGSGRRLAGESASSRRAVALTQGIACTRGGELFCTYYSAVCGGRTTSGAELFSDASDLTSIPCDWCRDSEYYRWNAEIDRQQFLKQVPALGTLSRLSSIRQTAGPGDGTISRFQISDGKTSTQVTGVQLRERLSTLRSPHFAVSLKAKHVQVEGRGHGHGVGFCQWGARGLGLAGQSAHEIVRYYYPGADLTVVDY